MLEFVKLQPEPVYINYLLVLSAVLNIFRDRFSFRIYYTEKAAI